MRSQVSNTGQSSKSNDQKKSVFDRLGRQLDTGRSMKRRPSPGQYGEYGMPPPPPPSVHEPDFGRYGPRDPLSQAELQWRYENERRHMAGPYPRDSRHPAQMAPRLPQPLPPPPPPSHYEMEMRNGRQPPYYPNPHPYHNTPQGPPPPPPMVAGNMAMTMHQQRSSPKYDRHGNLIPNFKDRAGGLMRGPGPIDHHPGMSPSRNFMPPGPMMHQVPHEMQGPGMGPPVGMYPPPRWPEMMEPEFAPPPHAIGRMIQDGRFSPAGSRRYQPHQQLQMMNPQTPGHLNLGGEAPRYTKWRERRDVITNLDKETAQSSSRTDSLKSTLQQPDNRGLVKSELQIDDVKRSRGLVNSKPQKASASARKELNQPIQTTTDSMGQTDKESAKSSADSGAAKTEPQDISDGEIVDDEDSSDDSETVKVPDDLGKDLLGKSYLNRNKHLPQASFVGRNRESHQYYESTKKKRRLLDREEYSMDYETISDEDLDDFMDDKKASDLGPEDVKLTARLGDEERKSLSEIELLNALGLDWANLVEIAKQSRATGKENSAQGSALPRFSITNYLPTLGITQELAGAEIYDLVLKVCRP